MAVNILFELKGETQMNLKLNKLGKSMKSWKPAFARITTELKRTFSNDVFKTQGKVIGEKWDPLTPEYLAKKREQGFSGGTLIRTGTMKGSFKSMFKSDQARIWNSIFYFKYHQSNQPRTKLPRRVMLKLGKQQVQLVVSVFEDHLARKIKRL